MFVPFLYQNECLTCIENTRQEARKSALIVMASGLGKTVTMAFDAKRWLERFGGRVLYLCHQIEMIDQSKTTFEAILGGQYSYGFFHGDEKNIHRVDCLFASFATMIKNLKQFSPTEFDYIVVDESHHSHADTFKQVIDYFTPKFLLGATATPKRLDKRNICEIYGEEVYNLPLPDALAQGLLTPVDYRMLSDEIQASGELTTPIGMMSIKALNKTIFVPKRDEEIVKIVQKHSAQFEQPRIIYFCSSVKHCDHLATIVPDSMTIHSRIRAKERAIRLELFRQGLISTVITVDCFNEGVDVPAANVVVFLRSTSSPTIFFQQLGRGLRLSEGKSSVLVLDFVSNCQRIQMVNNLWQTVKEKMSTFSGKHRTRGAKTKHPPMTLNVEGINFNQTIVQILEVLKRIGIVFYQTWQEASEAAIKLGITDSQSYKERYREDPRLPYSPYRVYKDFPGMPKFLGTDVYPTWQEASEATIKLGIKTQAEYTERYKEDPRLPGSPYGMYDDFPGIAIFLAIEPPYPTWEEASQATIKLGIKNTQEYNIRYKEDPRLVSDPIDRYRSTWPGMEIFLDIRYATFEEARQATQKLGITSASEYQKQKRYLEDPKLTSSPDVRYSKEWKGWKHFLGKNDESVYATYAEAQLAAKTLKIIGSADYQERYKDWLE